MSEAELIVRRAGANDWSLLRTIRLESLADTPEAFGSTYEESVTWPDSRWREMAATWVYFLAERDGRPVGMVSGGYNDERPGTRWMYGMYVTPAERGRGGASALVEAVSDWARGEGVHSLYLHVTTTVARARAFYEKMGFRWTGDTITMDRDPSITLVTMVRELLEDDFRVERVAPHALHDLRRRVLRSNNPEISVADPRDEEPSAVHYAGFLGDRLVVSASFYPSTSPVDPELPTYQLRYMATDVDVQARGYGARVMNEAERYLRSIGAQQLWANGRDTALGFYRATGWRVVEGSAHLSPETQLPHHVIVKRLEEPGA